MQAHLPEKEAIFRFAKIYIAQYLSTIHNFEAFNDEALNLLSLFMIKIMKQLAVKIKNILTLQGRTLPNALHVLVVAHQSESIDFERLLKFITKNRQLAFDLKSFDVIERLGKSIFQNDLQSVNNYPREPTYSNLRYIPPVFTLDHNKKALPYRHPIDEVLPLPPEVTYQETRQKVVKEKKNIEHLASYTRRQNRLAIVGRMIEEEQRKKEEKEVLRERDSQMLEEQQPEKKQKFDLISYL